jgi:hypothetical protein
MLLSYLIFSIPSTDFSDIFSAHFQPLENLLGLIQNLNQNLVAELAPLGLGDLSGLELAEVDVVLVFHAQRLDDFSETVKHFSDIFSDIFFAFVLDNPPGVKEKSVQKRKIFLQKKLDNVGADRVQWGIPRGYPHPPSPPPRGGGGGGEQIPCQGGWHASCCGAITIPYLETLRNSHNVPTVRGMLV